MADKIIVRIAKNKKRTFKSLKEAAKHFGKPYITVYMRVRAGMAPAVALKQPTRPYVRRIAA